MPLFNTQSSSANQYNQQATSQYGPAVSGFNRGATQAVGGGVAIGPQTGARVKIPGGRGGRGGRNRLGGGNTNTVDASINTTVNTVSPDILATLQHVTDSAIAAGHSDDIAALLAQQGKGNTAIGGNTGNTVVGNSLYSTPLSQTIANIPTWLKLVMAGGAIATVLFLFKRP